MPEKRRRFEATTRITAAGTAAVLVLTTYDSDGDILRAVEAGATGYLLKRRVPPRTGPCRCGRRTR
jgi:DNA-binding NarL/FixJ family response regulator